jgi:hypothetical protein
MLASTVLNSLKEHIKISEVVIAQEEKFEEIEAYSAVIFLGIFKYRSLWADQRIL